jgi:hypothetical protein
MYKNLKNKHYFQIHYVHYSTTLQNKSISRQQNQYTSKPKTENTLLLKCLSLIQHKVTKIMKMIITHQAHRINQFKDIE